MSTIRFTDNHKFAPFQHYTPTKIKFSDPVLIHKGTLYVGEPGATAINSTLRITVPGCQFAEAPVVSGGAISKLTREEVFVDVSDHANLTEFVIVLPAPDAVGRVGTPIVMNADLMADGVVTQSTKIFLGYISGISTCEVPYLQNPNSYNASERVSRTEVVISNHWNVCEVNAVIVNEFGEIDFCQLAAVTAGRTLKLTDQEIFDKLLSKNPDYKSSASVRLILCSTTPCDFLVRDVPLQVKTCIN